MKLLRPGQPPRWMDFFPPVATLYDRERRGSWNLMDSEIFFILGKTSNSDVEQHEISAKSKLKLSCYRKRDIVTALLWVQHAG